MILSLRGIFLRGYLAEFPVALQQGYLLQCNEFPLKEKEEFSNINLL